MNKEYGYALYELAAEEGIEKEIEKEFAEISSLINNNQDFADLLSNPRIPTSERIDVLDDIFRNQVHPYLLSLLKILVEKRNVSIIPLVFNEFKNKYYENKNILLVTAITAVLLNNDQKKRIIDKLERSMNKTIILENKVDKACVGGIRLEYNGRMIDASVKNRFQKLQLDLKNADYSVAEV